MGKSILSTVRGAANGLAKGAVAPCQSSRPQRSSRPSIATAAVTIVAHAVVVTPVNWPWRSVSGVGCAVVNWGRHVINWRRIDGRSDKTKKPEPDSNGDPTVCLGRGSGCQNSGEYRGRPHHSGAASNNTARRGYVHLLASSLSCPCRLIFKRDIIAQTRHCRGSNLRHSVT